MKEIVAPWINDANLKLAFENICSDIKTDNTKRNTVVHGDWGMGRSMSLSELIEQQKQDKAVAVRKNAAVKVKASDIMALAFRFGKHQMHLLDFWLEHVASKKKSSRQSSRPSRNAIQPRSPKRAKP
jgi:hypothetical protein